MDDQTIQVGWWTIVYLLFIANLVQTDVHISREESSETLGKKSAEVLEAAKNFVVRVRTNKFRR